MADEADLAGDRERRAERLIPDLGKQERARIAGKHALQQMMAKLGKRSRCEGTSGDGGDADRSEERPT